MLKQRVITAVVLLLILLPALFYPNPAAFSFLALVLISAGAWEWARLTGYTGTAPYATGVLCFLLCAAAWWAGALQPPFPWSSAWLVVGAVWVLGSGLLLRGGVDAWRALPKPFRMFCGIVVLVVAWLAVAQARVIGVNFLLSAMVLVWVADIFAYFAGKTLGGRFFAQKLAPSISPGKSWEGVCGGLLGVIVLALCWHWADQAYAASVPSIYSVLHGMGWWMLWIAPVFLAYMSVVGDLMESLLKRAAGAKDSSGLLPGHGGVLDRIDALLPALPLVMMLYFLK
jgi:phosphatidate cytidylyltransferase